MQNKPPNAPDPEVLNYGISPPPHGRITAWASLSFGLLGLVFPWGGPLFGLFNSIALKNWNLAIVVAFSPAIISIAFGIVALAILPKEKKQLHRTAAAVGIILSVIGFLFTLVSADMNWPYGSH